VLQTLVVLAAGAIVGAYCRFMFTHLSSQLTDHHGFPFGTLMVNVLGSFIVGYVLSWFSTRTLSDNWLLFIVTGFCGAFTTFSAFAFESISFLRDGRFLAFGVNVLLNNLLSMGAVLVGMYIQSDFR
jgi:CrcB protein